MNRRIPIALTFASAILMATPVAAQHEQHHSSEGHGHDHDKVTAKPFEAYGRVFMSIDYNDPGASGRSNTYLDSGGTVLGFRGSIPLDYNLTGIWQIESGMDLTELGSSNQSQLANYNSFFGLQGRLGRVVGGKHDTPYKNATHHLDIFHHLPGDYRIMLGNVADLNSGAGGHHGGAFNIRAPDILMYKSPKMNGLTFEVATFAFDETTTANANGDPSGYSASVIYEVGKVYATAAYEVHNNYDTYGDAHGGSTITVDKTEAGMVGLMVHHGMAMFAVIAERIDVEDSDTVNVPNKSRNAYYLSAQTGLEKTKLKLAYGKADDFQTDDGGQFLAAGISHNLSKHTEAYFVYTGVDNDVNGSYGTLKINALRTGADPSTFSVGVIHSF